MTNTPEGTSSQGVDRGRRCITCDYDLGGLSPGGVCPECGTPVEQSLKGRWLRHEDRAWVAKVCRGLWWMSKATTFFLVGLLLVIGGAAFGLLDVVRGAQSSFWIFLIIFATCGFLCMPILIAIGSFLVGSANTWDAHKLAPYAAWMKHLATSAIISCVLLFCSTDVSLGVAVSLQTLVISLLLAHYWGCIQAFHVLKSRCVANVFMSRRPPKQLTRSVIGVFIATSCFTVLPLFFPAGSGASYPIAVVVFFATLLSVSRSASQTLTLVREELAAGADNAARVTA